MIRLSKRFDKLDGNTLTNSAATYTRFVKTSVGRNGNPAGNSSHFRLDEWRIVQFIKLRHRSVGNRSWLWSMKYVYPLPPFARLNVDSSVPK